MNIPMHLEEDSRIQALKEEIAKLKAENVRLEQLCDKTYVANGADAYHHACSEMERWQAKRADQGKDPGCVGSLCDGMSRLQEMIEEAEAKVKAPISFLITPSPNRFYLTLFIGGRCFNCERSYLSRASALRAARAVGGVKELPSPDSFPKRKSVDLKKVVDRIKVRQNNNPRKKPSQ